MGIEGTAVWVKEGSDPSQTGLRFGVVYKVSAVIGVRTIGEQGIHAVRAHVDVPLIRVEGVAVVPVDAVQPQGQCDDDDTRQHEERPGNPAVQCQMVTKVSVWEHRSH